MQWMSQLFGQIPHLFRRISQMRIMSRLILLSFVLLMLLGVTNWLGFKGMQDMRTTVDVSYNQRTVPMVAMGKALDDINKAKSDIVLALLTQYDKDVPTYIEHMRQSERDFENDMSKELEKTDQTDDEKKLVLEYRAKWATYKDVRKKLVAQKVDDGDGPGATSALRVDYEPACDDLIATIDALFKLEEEQAKAGYVTATTDGDRITSVNKVVMGIGFIVSVLLSIWIIRSITEPLRIAIQIAERISHGDLTSRIRSSDGNDETARLMRSLASMQSSLQSVIHGIRDSSHTLSASAGALSSAFSLVADGAEQQSEAAQAIASAVEEMTVSFDQVNHNTQSALEKAENTSAVSGRGQKQVVRASQDINKIVDAVTEADRSIHSLEHYSTEINGIAAVIKEIADQTNLLALNAAIEAARAGEHGRGFAVVADEVRKLAEKTTQATGNIQSVLKTVQNETARAANAMVVSSQQVTIGVDAVNELIPTFNELIDGAGVARADLNDLAQSTKEQAITSSSIAQSVERIAQMVERSNEEINRTGDTVRELEQLAGELKTAVEKFQL